MSERPSEHAHPEHLVLAVRAKARETLGIDNGDLFDDEPAPHYERTIDGRLKPRVDPFFVQANEAGLLAEHLATVQTPDQFTHATDALMLWLKESRDVPQYHTSSGQINHWQIADSLLACGSGLINAGHDVGNVTAKILPFLDTSATKRTLQHLAKHMHRVIGEYGAWGGAGAQVRCTGEPRGVAMIMSAATDAGNIRPDFWYLKGVRTIDGVARFHMIEGMYEQMVLRGRDIRPKLLPNQLYDDLANFCSASLGMTGNDPERHIANGWSLHRSCELKRSPANKLLPFTVFIDLANSITTHINAMPNGFYESYDGQPAGPRPHLNIVNIHDLPEAMRRLLYVTRQPGADEEVAAFQEYQDFIISETVEALIGLAGSTRSTRTKLGATALGVAHSQDASRLVDGPPVYSWRRKRHRGYGMIS
jgi:hypothetical protein